MTLCALTLVVRKDRSFCGDLHAMSPVVVTGGGTFLLSGVGGNQIRGPYKEYHGAAGGAAGRRGRRVEASYFAAFF